MGPDGVAATPEQYGFNISSVWSRLGITAPSPTFLALPTVYHKLMLMCLPDSTGTTRMCTTDGGIATNGGVPTGCDPNPVFDIVTTASLASCRGEACRSAATAVLQYNELLNVVTPLRWDTIRISSGFAPLPDYIMNQGIWTLQRSCPALRNVVTNAAKVQAQLPAVMSSLQTAAPHLTAACIAGSRKFQTAFDASSGSATRILGELKSRENAEKWEDFQVRMLNQCQIA